MRERVIEGERKRASEEERARDDVYAIEALNQKQGELSRTKVACSL